MAKKSANSGLDIFTYDSALKFILDFIEMKGHGYKAEISRATECQSAYVSRVLSEKAYFSLEQSERLARLFLLNDLEERFFLTLSQRDRAGTKELKSYFNKLLKELRDSRKNLKARVKAPSEIDENDRHVYYGSWLYGAVYVMTSIPKYQSTEALSAALGVPAKKIITVLEFLVSIGLVKQQNQKYVIAAGSIHLGKESPLISKHHVNWRTRALNSIDQAHPEDLHYSLVMALSHDDLETIKGRIVDMIEETNKILGPSKEEEVQVLCIDLFGLR